MKALRGNSYGVKPLGIRSLFQMYIYGKGSEIIRSWEWYLICSVYDLKTVNNSNGTAHLTNVSMFTNISTTNFIRLYFLSFCKKLNLVYLQVVKSQKFINRHKIVPVKVDRRIHMMDFFHYASYHLLDKPVIALNGDIGRIISYQPPIIGGW